MFLKTKVIAADIQNLTDARYFAAWGVDYFSFTMDFDSEDFIEINNIKEILEWVEGPKVLGKITKEVEADVVTMWMNDLQFDGLIVNSLDLLERYHDLTPHIFVLKDNEAIPSENLVIANVEKSSLSELKDIAAVSALFLEGVQNVRHLEELLKEINPEGIVLKGGEEEKVGYKSYDDLDELFEWLEED